MIPSTDLLDDFNRASLGANWTGPILGATGSLAVSANQITGVSGSGAAGWNQRTFTDSEMFLDLPVLPTSGNKVYLYLRLSGLVGAAFANYSGYRLRVSPVDGTIILRRFDAGVDTQLLSIAQALTAGDSIGFRAAGSALTVYHKTAAGAWTQVGTATDAVYASGYMAVQLPDATVRADNLTAGHIAVEPAQAGWSRVASTTFDGLSAVPDPWQSYVTQFSSPPYTWVIDSHCVVANDMLTLLFQYETSGPGGATWYAGGLLTKAANMATNTVDQCVTFRFRVVSTGGIAGHKNLPLRWPLSGVFPGDGEEDLFEIIEATGDWANVLHWDDGGGDPPGTLYHPYPTISPDVSSWHTLRVQREGLVFTCWLDDMATPVLVFGATHIQAPATAKRPIFQQEALRTGFPTGTTGKEEIQIDWVTVDVPTGSQPPDPPLLDAFTRANGGLGASWQVATGTGLQIVSNQVQAAAASYQSSQYVAGGQVKPPFFYHLTVPTMGVDGDHLELRVAQYGCDLTKQSGLDRTRLFRYPVPSGSTVVLQTDTGLEWGAGDKLGLEVTATGELRAWRQPSGSGTWTPVCAWYDTTYLATGGYPELILQNQTWRVDDFEGVGTSLLAGFTIPAGQTSTVEVSQPVGKRKARGIMQANESGGTAAEIDFPQPVTRRKRKTLAQVLVVESARPFSSFQPVVVGQAATVTTALAVTHRKTEALGQALSSSSAQPVVSGDRIAVSQAAVTSLAQPVAKLKRKTLLIATATLETALAAAERKTRTVSQPATTELSQPVAKLKRRVVSPASTNQDALSIGLVPRYPVTTIAETAVAQPVAVRKAVVLTVPIETELVHAVGHAKALAAGQAAETDTVIPATVMVGVTVGQTVETGFATAAVVNKAVQVAQTVEVSDAAPATAGTSHPVGVTGETGEALPVGKHKLLAVGQAFESDMASAGGDVQTQSVPVGAAAEIEVACGLVRRRKTRAGHGRTVIRPARHRQRVTVTSGRTRV